MALTKSDALQYFKIFLQLSQGKNHDPVEFNYLKKNKTKGLGLAYFNVSRYEDKDTEIFAIVRDITEQRKMEKELERLSMNLENLISGRIHDHINLQPLTPEKSLETLANELLEPLNAIKNALYVVKQHPEKILRCTILSL